MDNQHRKIAGYRELTQADIDLMNEIKSQGRGLEGAINAALAHISKQRRAVSTMQNVSKAGVISAELAAVYRITPVEKLGSNGFHPLSFAEIRALADRAAEETQRLDAAQPERWAAIARTHFQEGLMALTRAVAQPTFF